MAKDSLPAIDEKGNLKTIKFAEKSIDNGALTIAFGDGKTVSVSLDDLSEEIVRDLALHGLSQKVGDSYASAKGDYGFALTAATKVIDQLKAGEWKAARGTGESKPRIGELAQAVARIKKITETEALALIEKLSEEDKKAVRNHPGIKLAIQQIRTEKAQKAADAAGELSI